MALFENNRKLKGQKVHLGLGTSTLNREISSQGSGLRDMRHKWQLFQMKTLMTKVILSLILRFNRRLGGYSIWSASTSRTTYEGKDPGLEHLIASMQPRKYSKDYSKHSMGSKPGQLPGWWIPEAFDQMEETWKLLDAMRVG